MIAIRRTLAGIALAGPATVSACADPGPVGRTGRDAEEAAPDRPDRLAAYRAPIRYLVDPTGPQPIRIAPRLCITLTEPDISCPREAPCAADSAAAERCTSSCEPRAATRWPAATRRTARGSR